MIIITSEKNIPDRLNGNKIQGRFTLINSSINFNGKNNILYFSGDVVLKNSGISFSGDNSVIFICSSTRYLIVNLSAAYDSSIYIGEHIYTNNIVSLLAIERTNILIGKECLFSVGIKMRTGDAHAIYDIKTKKRINNSKSILIGDHVWIGQNVFLLKGTHIGSGSIIGADSIVANKRIESNSIFAGNPAKRVRTRIFFTNYCTNGFCDSETAAFNHSSDGDAYIYKYKKRFDGYFSKIDNELKESPNADARLKILNKKIHNISNINRFMVRGKPFFARLTARIKPLRALSGAISEGIAQFLKRVKNFGNP